MPGAPTTTCTPSSTTTASCTRSRRSGRTRRATARTVGTAIGGRVPGQRVPRLGILDGAPHRVRPAAVPPVPPPPVPNPSEPLTFDDASPEPVPATFMTGNEDRVIHSINHRPRRLGGPAAAVGAVLVLVLVLILTGLHSDTSKHHGKAASARRPRPATTHPAGHASSPCDDDDHHQHDRAARRLGADGGDGAHGDLHGGRGRLLADHRRHHGGVLGGRHQHRDGRGALHDDAAVRPVPRHRRHRTGHGDRRRARQRSRPPSTAHR